MKKLSICYGARGLISCRSPYSGPDESNGVVLVLKRKLAWLSDTQFKVEGNGHEVRCETVLAGT